MSRTNLVFDIRSPVKYKNGYKGIFNIKGSKYVGEVLSKRKELVYNKDIDRYVEIFVHKVKVIF